MLTPCKRNALAGANIRFGTIKRDLGATIGGNDNTNYTAYTASSWRWTNRGVESTATGSESQSI